MHVWSWSGSWEGDPKRLGVIIGGGCANRRETRHVPDILRVVPRPDALYNFAAVIGEQVRWRRETAEYLRSTDGVDISVVVAAHVHPRFVVAPPPLRDEFLRHDVRQR